MDEINIRFRQLREAAGMCQEDWGKILGISRSGVSEIESGRRKVTEKHILMLSNWKGRTVNINWLRTGEGGESNMFLSPQKNDLVAKAAMLLGEHDPVFEAFIETYGKLSPANRKVLQEFLANYLQNLKSSVGGGN